MTDSGLNCCDNFFGPAVSKLFVTNVMKTVYSHFRGLFCSDTAVLPQYSQSVPKGEPGSRVGWESQ